MFNWLMLVAVLISSEQEAQFDLECVGYKSGIIVDGEYMDGREAPGSSRMMLDLARLAWCNNSCSYVRSLRVEGDKIIFPPSKSKPDSDWIDGGEINRRNGELIWFATPSAEAKSGKPAYMVRQHYRCARAKFSGIPERPI